jgi:hypothetical protein
MIGAILLLAAVQQPADGISPTVRDIIAGYKAWDIACDASACSTQASDQVTTISLKRTAGGLAITLAARRCPETTPEGQAFIPAKLLRPANRTRLGRVYSAFTSLDDRVLRSCGKEFDSVRPHVYDLRLLDRFLKQSDVVAGASAGSGSNRQ